VSKDNEKYEVPVDVMLMSTLVKDTVGEIDEDDEGESEPIPLNNVSSTVLEKVIAFCTHFKEEPMTEIQTPLKSNQIDQLVQEWYADFVKVDKDLLFSLVAAANYLDIKQLLDLTCLAVSILIKGKSATELREMFNITAELTAEEQAQIQQENNQWQQQAAADAAAGGDAAAPEAAPAAENAES